MRRFKIAVWVAVFVAGGIVSQFVVASAFAANTRPARWEYMCVDGWAGITHSSNQLGKEGWELAAAAGTSNHMMWCFKRSLP